MTDLGLVLVDLPPDGPAGVGPLAAAAEAAGVGRLAHRPPALAPAVRRRHRGLHAVAAATSRCRLGPCVLQLPLRDLAGTAKSMAYLGALAGDRLVVGVGVGEHRREYELCGHGDRFERRGRLLDAGIADLRERWAPPSGDERLVLAPTASPPIWVGGRSRPPGAGPPGSATAGSAPVPGRLVRRRGLPARRRPPRRGPRGGGVHPRCGRRRLRRRRGARDRPCAWLGRLYDLPPAAFGRAVVRGSAAAIVDELAAFAAAGADHLALVVAGDRPVDHLRAVLGARAGREG
ncbi:MAG: LLM class flavin-dependent oxidoreductase [Acidimicrobiales bacterium]